MIRNDPNPKAVAAILDEREYACAGGNFNLAPNDWVEIDKNCCPPCPYNRYLMQVARCEPNELIIKLFNQELGYHTEQPIGLEWVTNAFRRSEEV